MGLTLTGWTIAAGFRILLRDRPWQPYLLCAYVAFIGNIGLGTFIDIDHWRHVYLLLGMMWGAIALEYRHQRQLRPASQPTSAAAIPSGRLTFSSTQSRHASLHNFRVQD